MPSPRIIILVLDACGVGGAPDAEAYGDFGAATIPHVAKAVSGLKMPNAGNLGLGCITGIEGIRPSQNPTGSYGQLFPRSAGKDSTTGHWELAGLLLTTPSPCFRMVFRRK